MRFTTAKAHRDFFRQEGWIEFDTFYSPEQIDTLSSMVLNALTSCLRIPSTHIEAAPPNLLFQAGHDLWRQNDALYKWLLHAKIASILGELTGVEMIRLGYDQFLPPALPQEPSDSLKEQDPYTQWCSTPTTLEQKSSIKGIAGGVLISLSHHPIPEITPSIKGRSPFFLSPGSALFLSSAHMIEWGQLQQASWPGFYLIVFAKEIAHYQPNTNDPHHSFLKGLGYSIKGRLNNRFHPIVIRR